MKMHIGSFELETGPGFYLKAPFFGACFIGYSERDATQPWLDRWREGETRYLQLGDTLVTYSPWAECQRVDKANEERRKAFHEELERGRALEQQVTA